MTRVKRGVAASKRRKKVIKMAKGYRWKRKSTFRAAKEALLKAGKYAYRDRRTKKRTMRSLWITRLNAGLRENGLTYSKFMKLLKDKKVELDRKALSQLAMEKPAALASLIKQVTK